jgi:hypothetical protein
MHFCNVSFLYSDVDFWKSSCLILLIFWKSFQVTALALKQMMANAAAAVTTEDRNAEEEDKPIDWSGKGKEERQEVRGEESVSTTE